MTIYTEYDIVYAARDLSQDILKGCLGTVVMVFTAPSEGYLVEFLDDNGDYRDVVTVDATDITKKKEGS